MDHRVEDVLRDKDLAAMMVCRDYIINFKGQIADLTRQLEELREEVIRLSQLAFTAKFQWDEALAQLSLLEETRQQRDEALSCAIVLQHELNKQVEDVKGLTLTVENSQLQQ